MNVEQRIKNFYEQLEEDFSKLEVGTVYKVESEHENFNNVVLKNDDGQDIKPYLEYYGKVEEGENYIHSFKYNFRSKNENDLILTSQWLDLADDSIISIDRF
jgi:hypothetical protein